MGLNATIADDQALLQYGMLIYDGHPESFQPLGKDQRKIVNVPDADEIAVVDRATSTQIAAWHVQGLASNFPLVLDESNDD